MKTKLLVIILFFSIPAVIWSNPIDATPRFKLSELAFDAHKNWTMEIIFSDSMSIRFWQSIDSIVIKTSGTASKLNIKMRMDDYFVINSDSLTIPLHINPDGDKIIIETYSSSKIRTDSVVFGNYPGAYVGRPLPGCSICRYRVEEFDNYADFLYLSQKPSLGKVNSIEGIGTKMTGHIYDKDNKLVTKYFYIYTPPYFEFQRSINFNPDGTYSTIIYPMAYYPDSITINKLTVRMNGWDSWHNTQEIEPLSLTYISPDSILIRDIHLKSNEYVLTGVERNELPKNTELTLINYPNPFNSSTNFFVKLPDDIKENSGDINIYNAAGRLVRTVSVKNGSTSLWDGRDMNGSVMASGIYFYQLNIKNNVLKSGSMILLK